MFVTGIALREMKLFSLYRDRIKCVNWTTSRHAILNMSIHIEPIIMYLIHLDSLSPNLQLDTKTTFLA